MQHISVLSKRVNILISGVVLSTGLYGTLPSDKFDDGVTVRLAATQETSVQKYKEPETFSITNVVESDAHAKEVIMKALTRTDIKPRLDDEGGVYGNLFASQPHLVDVILKASKTFSIHPYFLTAVLMQESGNGTSYSLYERNNTSGMRCMSPDSIRAIKQVYPDYGEVGCVRTADHGEYATFSSIEDCIVYTSWLFRNVYANQGLLTVEEIGRVYAPVGDVGDPEGFNEEWTAGVKSKLIQMGVQNL